MGAVSCGRSRLIVGAFAGMLLTAGPALAYTSEQQQACTDDAMRLCSAFIPDVDRITACMTEKKEQLTPGCRAQFGPPPVAAQPVSLKPRPAKAGKPRAVRKQAKSRS